MQVFVQSLGVQLRFTVYIDGAPADFASPAPEAIALLVAGGGEIPLVPDQADHSVATREQAAGDFPSVGSFEAVVRLTYDADHVFYSAQFPLQVSNAL